jgi:dGTPase
MDFSDDVAYSVHDFEDAVVEGFIKLEQLKGSAQEDAIVKEIERWNGNRIESSVLAAALDRLQANQYWLTSYSGTPREQGQLKNLTSSVIGSFVSRTTAETFKANADSLFARYAADVIVPEEVEAEIAIFKGLASYFLMSLKDRVGYYDDQRALLCELADVLLASNGKHLDGYSLEAWNRAKSDNEQHRVIVDQIAVLTDAAAVKMHEVLVLKKDSN